MAHEQVLEEVRLPIDGRVSGDEPVRTVDEGCARLGELLERRLAQLDEDAVVAARIPELAAVQLVGVVEHRVCRCGHHRCPALVLDHDRNSREDDMRPVTDQVQRTPGGVGRRTTELAHREQRGLEHDRDGRHIRFDAVRPAPVSGGAPTATR